MNPQSKIAFVGCAERSGMKSNGVAKFERMRTTTVKFVSNVVYDKLNVAVRKTHPTIAEHNLGLL